MPSILTTPLQNVEWGEFQAEWDSQTAALVTEIEKFFNVTYIGKEETIPGLLLNGSKNHVQRVRELLTSGATIPSDNALIIAMQPFDRLSMEYQLRKDINGDGKIYAWDYVYVDDYLTDDIEPQPMIRDIATIDEVRAKVNAGTIEIIAGNMPPDGMYVPGVHNAGIGQVLWVEDGNSNSLTDVVMTINGNPKTVKTLYDGFYLFAGLAAGSYTVVPSLAGYTFAPASRTFTVTTGNVVGQDFVATRVY